MLHVCNLRKRFQQSWRSVGRYDTAFSEEVAIFQGTICCNK